MALDRQSIEKKDFPIARRGYEPEAVDAHLARLAGEIEALQRQQGTGTRSPGGSASLALAASEQVRTIVEAAESSAADIEAAAQDDAARIRAEADADARQTRDDAVARSQEHVGKVGEATTLMLQRVDAMESELGALLDSLRTGSNRLNADLSLLQGNMGELYGAAGSSAPAPRHAPEPVAAPEPIEPELAAEESTAVAPPAAGLFTSTEPAAAPPAEPEPEAAAAPPVEPEPVAAPAPASDADVEGARLIALNMALNGQPRAETDRYLAENFDLADRAGLLDEVYATVEG